MVNIRQLDQDSDLYPGDEPDPVCALSFNQMSHGDTRWLNTPVPYGSKGLCSLYTSSSSSSSLSEHPTKLVSNQQ